MILFFVRFYISSHQLICDIYVINLKKRYFLLQADVLVNTMHPSFNLSKGSVSKSLLQAAGKEMQKEIDQKFRRNITVGEIVVTRGYKLKCQYVFHGVLYDYAGPPVDSMAFYKEVRKCSIYCSCTSKINRKISLSQ